MSTEQDGAASWVEARSRDLYERELVRVYSRQFVRDRRESP